MVQMWGVGFISTVILLGVIDDIRSRKYHNALFLTSLAATILFRIVHDGMLLQGAIACISTLAVGIVFWKLRILGAGDVKLLSVIGLATDTNTIFSIFLYSLIWGSVFSFIALLFSGELKNLWLNAKNLNFQSRVKIPYTVAILLGWAQWLHFNGGLL